MANNSMKELDLVQIQGESMNILKIHFTNILLFLGLNTKVIIALVKLMKTQRKHVTHRIVQVNAHNCQFYHYK